MRDMAGVGMRVLAVVLMLALVTGCATKASPTPQSVAQTADQKDASKNFASKKVNDAVSGDQKAKGRDNDANSVVIASETLKPPAPQAQEKKSETPPAQPPVEAVPTSAEYLLGPGDILNFRSFDDPTLSTQVAIRYDGFISLPMISDIKVDGMTREQAIKAVQEAYVVLYKKPHISLSVMDTKSKKFTVMGEVTRPAEYPYLQPITLIEAITLAGGLRINQRGGDSYVGTQGQLTKAVVVRHKGAAREVLDFDLRNFRQSGPHASDTPVYPGDLVYVPENVNLAYVLGEVRQPGVYPIDEDMTLLRLISRSGGAVEGTARMKQIVLLRETDPANTKVTLLDMRKILATGDSIKVQPGDILYVPRRRLVNAREFIQQLTGTVTPILSLSQQVMSLYSQAYDTYYTKERYDRLFNNATSTQATDSLALLQSMRDLAAITVSGTQSTAQPTK